MNLTEMQKNVENAIGHWQQKVEEAVSELRRCEGEYRLLQAMIEQETAKSDVPESDVIEGEFVEQDEAPDEA